MRSTRKSRVCSSSSKKTADSTPAQRRRDALPAQGGRARLQAESWSLSVHSTFEGTDLDRLGLHMQKQLRILRARLRNYRAWLRQTLEETPELKAEYELQNSSGRGLDD